MNYTFRDKKEEFLINEMIQSSINSGLQTRNQDFPIYNFEQLQLNDAKNLRKDIHFYLLNCLTEYADITEEKHVKIIKTLSSDISLKYGKILHNKRFRIGVSQKIVNLFLKHMWVIGKIEEPLHCPFDNIIKVKILVGNKSVVLKDWTELDQISEYKKYVSFARLKAAESKTTIAHWELENWKNR